MLLPELRLAVYVSAFLQYSKHFLTSATVSIPGLPYSYSILAGIGYYPPDGALDVQAQLAVFKAQGLVKGNTDSRSIIDTQFLQKS